MPYPENLQMRVIYCDLEDCRMKGPYTLCYDSCISDNWITMLLLWKWSLSSVSWYMTRKMQDCVLVPMHHSLCHIQHHTPQHHDSVHYVAVGDAIIFFFKIEQPEHLLMFKSLRIFLWVRKTNIFFFNSNIVYFHFFRYFPKIQIGGRFLLPCSPHACYKLIF